MAASRSHRSTFLYDSDSPTDTQAAQIIASNLGSIGITVNPTGLPYKTYSSVIYSPSTNSTSYPMGIGFYSEDYTASIDYVYYFTSDNYIGTSNYADANAIAWTLNASTSFSPSAVISELRQHNPIHVLQLHGHLALRSR